MRKIGDYITTSEKGANNGVATLDNSGQVPASQLGNASSGGDTIYTADDTVTSDRTVSLDTKVLTFDAGTTTTTAPVGIVLDSRNVFSTGTAAPAIFKVLGLSGNEVFNLNSRGYFISTSDYTTAIAKIENRAGTQGLTLANNVSDIATQQFRHLATNSDITDRIEQTVTNVYQQWIMTKNNVKSHWIRNGDGAAQACFFIEGVTGRGFNVGGGDDIDGEKISLQDRTAIKGAGTTTGITLALYDNDTTPNKTWEWLDNGTMKGYNGAKIEDALLLPSVQEATNSATFTINADEETDGVLTAMSANTTLAAPTGTPVQSQDLVFRFKDDGTARTLTWNAIFRAIGVTLPTTTVANKLTYVGCKYNSTDTKWDVIAVQQEA
tara:strand:+ start:13391 stop:14530 length:1140 start_codon:yes stop_codon:yes gene_type:complete